MAFFSFFLKNHCPRQITVLEVEAETTQSLLDEEDEDKKIAGVRLRATDSKVFKNQNQTRASLSWTDWSIKSWGKDYTYIVFGMKKTWRRKWLV